MSALSMQACKLNASCCCSAARQSGAELYAAVLPINLAGSRIAPQPATQLTGPLPLRASSSTFARLTISNLEKGSNHYWCAPLTLQQPLSSVKTSYCVRRRVQKCPAVLK